MPIFRKRTKATEPPLNDSTILDRLPAGPDPAPRTGIARWLPIGDIVQGITGILRDPNGKISSKRAGAGALVTAGIYFLDRGELPAGITCLGFATALFFLTKFDPQA